MIEPALVILDLDKEMRVEMDVLNFTMEEVLSIKCENEKQRLVAYILKLLNKAKQAKIHDKEMLALIRCLEACRHFLEGAKSQFEIWIDHKNLNYFMKPQKLNQRQARQALYLSRLDFALKYVAGKSIGQAYSLSKRVDQVEEAEIDNENQVMLKKKWWEIRAMEKEQLLIEGAKEKIIEIKKQEAKDNEIVKAVKEMKKARV